MKWPPPSPTIDPPVSDQPADPFQTAPAAPRLESDDERRRNSATPAAAWIALLGSALLIVAAIAVVASTWDTIGQSLRVGGLVLVTGGLLLLAERTRQLVPTTAGIIAHVGTFLVGFAAIAVMSLFGFTWPACLSAGGVAIAIATTLQAPRWREVTMHAGQVAGIALAATGAAAVMDTSAWLLAAVASVGLLAMGGHRRSVGLALLAVFSPLLTALADAGIGSGALERAGLVGDRLSWSGPMVGLLAATVLGVVALQRRNNPLMLLAVLAPVMGVITGLASINGSAIAWWCVPALIVLAAELGWWLLPADQFKPAIGTAVSILAGTVAVGAWFSPVIARTDLVGAGLTNPWAIPIGATAVALALTTLRWRRTADSLLADLGIAAIAAAVIGTFVAFDAPAEVTATGAVLITAAAAFTRRRLGALAIYPTAFWALVSIAEIDPPREWNIELVFPLVLLGALAAMVVLIRARIAARLNVVGWVELSLLTLATVATAFELTPSNGSTTTVLVAAVLIGLLASLIEPRHTIWTVAAIGATGMIAFRAAGTAEIESTYWIGWAAATAAFGVMWFVHRSPMSSYAAASAAVLTVAAAAGGLDVTPEDFTVMAMLGVVALTGVAYTMPRRSALDAQRRQPGCCSWRRPRSTSIRPGSRADGS